MSGIAVPAARGEGDADGCEAAEDAGDEAGRGVGGDVVMPGIGAIVGFGFGVAMIMPGIGPID